MLRKCILVLVWPTTFSPLIQEARDRQRRRRVLLAQLAALVAVLGLAAAARSPGGGPATPTFSDSSGGAQASVRSVIAQFDSALASRDYVRACSLLDPWMGLATLRSSTNDVGIRGNCEQRLAGVVRIAGPRLVAELDRSFVASMELGGSESTGFVAAATMNVQDDLVRRNTWAPIVGVAKYAPHARVLLTCPPLICAAGFLAEVRARNRSARS
jgi:hypothetical protein